MFDGSLNHSPDLMQRQRTRLQRELPNRDHRAEREQSVQSCFQNIAAFFF